MLINTLKRSAYTMKSRVITLPPIIVIGIESLNQNGQWQCHCYGLDHGALARQVLYDINVTFYSTVVSDQLPRTGNSAICLFLVHKLPMYVVSVLPIFGAPCCRTVALSSFPVGIKGTFKD